MNKNNRIKTEIRPLGKYTNCCLYIPKGHPCFGLDHFQINTRYEIPGISHPFGSAELITLGACPVESKSQISHWLLKYYTSTEVSIEYAQQLIDKLAWEFMKIQILNQRKNEYSKRTI